MKKPLLHTAAISPRCAYCLHSSPAPDGEHVLCAKKGVMLMDSACKKYSYDPLKRQPRLRPALPNYEEAEFQL